jgi:hypothetical protein
VHPGHFIPSLLFDCHLAFLSLSPALPGLTTSLIVPSLLAVKVTPSHAFQSPHKSTRPPIKPPAPRKTTKAKANFPRVYSLARSLARSLVLARLDSTPSDSEPTWHLGLLHHRALFSSGQPWAARIHLTRDSAPPVTSTRIRSSRGSLRRPDHNPTTRHFCLFSSSYIQPPQSDEHNRLSAHLRSTAFT